MHIEDRKKIEYQIPTEISFYSHKYYCKQHQASDFYTFFCPFIQFLLKCGIQLLKQTDYILEYVVTGSIFFLQAYYENVNTDSFKAVIEYVVSFEIKHKLEH